MDHRTIHAIGIAAVIITGLIVLGTGVWFMISDHPFGSMMGDTNGYSEELDLTREEARAVSPGLEAWAIHVSDQVGSLSIGWALFVVALAALDYRRRDHGLQLVLAIGGLPMLAYATFEEFAHFEAIWNPGTLLSILVFPLFIFGLALMYTGTSSVSNTENDR